MTFSGRLCHKCRVFSSLVLSQRMEEVGSLSVGREGIQPNVRLMQAMGGD